MILTNRIDDQRRLRASKFFLLLQLLLLSIELILIDHINCSLFRTDDPLKDAFNPQPMEIVSQGSSKFDGHNQIQTYQQSRTDFPIDDQDFEPLKRPKSSSKVPTHQIDRLPGFDSLPSLSGSFEDFQTGRIDMRRTRIRKGKALDDLTMSDRRYFLGSSSSSSSSSGGGKNFLSLKIQRPLNKKSTKKAKFTEKSMRKISKIVDEYLEDFEKMVKESKDQISNSRISRETIDSVQNKSLERWPAFGRGHSRIFDSYSEKINSFKFEGEEEEEEEEEQEEELEKALKGLSIKEISPDPLNILSRPKKNSIKIIEAHNQDSTKLGIYNQRVKSLIERLKLEERTNLEIENLRMNWLDDLSKKFKNNYKDNNIKNEKVVEKFISNNLMVWIERVRLSTFLAIDNLKNLERFFGFTKATIGEEEEEEEEEERCLNSFESLIKFWNEIKISNVVPRTTEIFDCLNKNPSSESDGRSYFEDLKVYVSIYLTNHYSTPPPPSSSSSSSSSNLSPDSDLVNFEMIYLIIEKLAIENFPLRFKEKVLSKGDDERISRRENFKNFIFDNYFK